MKDMDRVWRELIEAMFMDIAMQSLYAVRPAGIEIGAEIDTEKLDEAYAKSEYIKEYNKDEC